MCANHHSDAIHDTAQAARAAPRSRWRALLALFCVTAFAAPAPAAVIYDAGLNTLPSAQGFAFLSLPPGAVQSVAGGVYTLDTTASSSISAGSSRADLPLDMDQGIRLTIRMRVVSESHSTSDRAGFSIILVGSDPTRALDLAFWDNEVWYYPSAAFTHGSGYALHTSSAFHTYALDLVGSAFALRVDGAPALSGSLVDYSGFGFPYNVPNFLFFGDDTSSASARVEISQITLSALPLPGASWLLGAGLLAWHWRRRAAR